MYNQFIFRPLYNGLVGIMDLLPWIDVGIAVIIFTVIIKLILYPLSKSALLTQIRMREIEPEAAKIRTQYAGDRQTQALKIMELYKSKGVKPFSGTLLLLLQLPILLSIISVFYKIIPEVQKNLLYPFVLTHLGTLHTTFLGLIDLTHPSLILALITAVAQFLQIKYSFASNMPVKQPEAGGTSMQFAATMNTQMKYLVPILAFVSIYWIIPARFPQASSIIAIYWMTSSLMTFLQELNIRKRHLKV
ncbi:MAG: 60 kDa inner rane insertion protein preprotein translocase subunit YidC [Candidatus Parcubacteria bacterium]|nr:60 kDa inner rane insertion protein preprotein translocase subunit YidC [Candidatus Parcubacteria bacterium]